MGLINCPECKKEISDQAKHCPNCGYILKNKKIKLKISKKIKNIGILLSITILIVILVFSYTSNHFSADEKIALENVKYFQQRLKDPNSLEINEDVLVLFFENDNSIYSNTFFEYSAKNSYGSLNYDLAIFEDDEYLGCYSNQEDDSETVEEAEKKVAIEMAMLRMKVYKILGASADNDSTAFTSRDIWVSKNKIMRKIK